MRPDLRNVACILALLCAARGSFAATDPRTPAALPPDAPNPISEALCGRPSVERARAEALDAFELGAVPEAWRKLKREELDPWLEVSVCEKVTPSEQSLFIRRRKVLQGFRSHLDRALRIDRFEQAVLAFPTWKAANDRWPGAGECMECDELRRAAANAMSAVSEWPKRKKDDVNATWLGDGEKRESLIALLCRVRPSSAARADMEKRFRYYTWTAAGAKLLEVAEWFERPDVLEECGPR